MNAPADLSAIAQCLRIAAQRGQALRLVREVTQQEADGRNDESQASDDRREDECAQTDPVPEHGVDEKMSNQADRLTDAAHRRRYQSNREVE
jgi:hypothetical protein